MKIVPIFIGSFLLMQSIFAIHPQQDANGYRYRNEQTVQDKRKIAVLSYGSLVNQCANRHTGACIETYGFHPTSLTLPVSITHLSQTHRFTAVIDNNGYPKRVYAAQSKFQFLPNARNNLAAREGSSYRSQDRGYDLKYMFYMKKLAPVARKDSNEEIIPGTNWAILIPENSRQKLSNATAQSIAQWADSQNYSAVIWASFPPNVESQKAAATKILEDNDLYYNTKDYIINLPDGPQSPFEKAVVQGPEAVREFIRMRESNRVGYRKCCSAKRCCK